MNEGQWLLEYDAVQLTLGSDPALGAFMQRGLHHVTAPKIGESVLTADDSDNPRTDGVSFGQDTFGATTVTFDLGLLGVDRDDVLLVANELSWKWRADSVRKVEGKMATLTAHTGGRERTMYGRPRRMDPPTHTKPRSSYMTATCTFDLVINQFYSTALQSVAVGFVPPPSGGFTAPFTTPLTTVSSSEEEAAVVVGGDLDAAPMITINGPITNPYARVPGLWELQLGMSILAGQSVTIDCRPWEQTVYRQDGASYAGALTRGKDRLDQALLPPGTHPIALGGTDPTGTSSMTFAWRDTYSYI